MAADLSKECQSTTCRDCSGAAANGVENQQRQFREPAGMLQWTYNWTGGTSAPGSLRVDFVSKTPNAWYVNSWEWANY